MTEIPKSKAKTAYGLLSEIRRLIVEEPKRYDQFDTLMIRGQAIGDELSYPACGTVGCVAGWVVALKHPSPANVYDTDTVCGWAQTMLGLAVDAADALFDAGAAGVSDAQTAKHAKAGAKHIAAFQKKYRSQLLAKKV